MASINRIVLVGRLTAQPELRITSNSVSVANITLAVDRRQTQNNKKDADFIECVLFGSLAEVCCKYLDKGQQVAVDGRLQTRSWKARDGSSRKTVEVVAESVQFLSKSKGRDEGANDYE